MIRVIPYYVTKMANGMAHQITFNKIDPGTCKRPEARSHRSKISEITMPTANAIQAIPSNIKRELSKAELLVSWGSACDGVGGDLFILRQSFVECRCMENM
jgi:hypothetical protein